jgi:hypothetical protein
VVLKAVVLNEVVLDDRGARLGFTEDCDELVDVPVAGAGVNTIEVATKSITETRRIQRRYNVAPASRRLR